MGVFRFLFFPIVRAAEQLKDSSQGLGKAVAGAKAKVNEISGRGEVASPKERFDELVREGQWTDADLQQQLVAVRRTKFFAMATVPLVLVMVGWLIASAPALLTVVLLPAGMFGIALGLVMTMKYTLFQEQLRRRSLVSMRLLLGESDFWSKVFW